MPTTIRDVASRAGVSVATVSRALNDQARVSASTRDRVRRVAADLGYRPDELARHLVTRRSTTVAMVVPDITNPFFPELVDGVHRACQERAHGLLLLQSPAVPDEVPAVLDQLAGRRLAGVVLVGGALPLARVTEVLGPCPVVVADRSGEEQDPGALAPVVRADHREGGRLAGEHLMSLGHRRIGHVSGPGSVVVAQERLAGLRDALGAHGVALPDDHVVEGDFGEASGHAGARTLLARHPDLTAIVTANDLMAIGAVRALDDAGHDVPARTSVVGYDDIHLARYVRPALTTVRQPVADLGRRAVARLLDGPDGAGSADGETADTVLTVELVVRDSTGPAPTTRRT